MHLAQKRYLLGKAGQLGVGGFQVERQVPQLRMVRDGGERLEADLPLADARVAVLARAARVLGVVEVDGAQTVEADDAVELLDRKSVV